MIQVSLAVSSISPGDPLEIVVSGYPPSAEITSVEVQIFDHRPEASRWKMTTDAPVAGADGGGLVVTVEATHDLSTDAVQEVRRLELRAEGSPRHVLQGGRDFRRLFFEVRAEQAEPHSEDALRIAALEFEETRQIAEALPVGDQFEDGAEEFRVASFAERSLLTRPLQLRGFRLLPLTEGKSAAGEASMLNLALDQLSFTAGVPLDQWADVSAASRPLVVFDFPRVFGASLESAIRKATGISERLLHLLASPGPRFSWTPDWGRLPLRRRYP